MALSRSRLGAAILIGLAPATAAAAQLDPPRDPVSEQQAEVRAMVSCPRAVGDEIVVCGRREEEEARRFRVEPTPPAPSAADRAGGAQRDALAIDTSRCTPVGRDQRCGGGLDVLGIAATIVRGIIAIRARRD
jgi:hypothetical protein